MTRSRDKLASRRFGFCRAYPASRDCTCSRIDRPAKQLLTIAQIAEHQVRARCQVLDLDGLAKRSCFVDDLPRLGEVNSSLRPCR
jgi:hypothetical protein